MRYARFSTGFIYKFPEEKSICDILYFGGDSFRIDEANEIGLLRWTYHDIPIILRRLEPHIRLIESTINDLLPIKESTQHLYMELSSIPEYYRLGALLYHQLQYQSVVSVEFDY
jgi:hypothetical protein